MTEEQENFYRHSTVIVDETKDSFLHLLDFHLKNHGLAFQRFIEINSHETYHLCYNRYPCCLCPRGTRTGIIGSRVLHPPQLEIFLDKTGRKLPGHNPRSISAPDCCCPVNPNLQLQDLDFTLARFLLINFTKLVQQGSPERNALDFLVYSRNHSFAHAKEGKISNSDYQNSMSQIETSLLVLAKVYGKEAETKQRLRDIAKQPLNIAICLQLQNTLLRQCEIDETIRRFVYVVDKALPEYLTKDLEHIKIVEGCDAVLEFWTLERDVNVEWYKGDNIIELSDKYAVEMTCQMHKLVVTNAGLTDRGIYIAKLLGHERKANLDIQEYFTKNMKKTFECIEGDNVELSCEVREANIPAHWTKYNITIKPSSKYTIKDMGKSHMLSVIQLDLRDAGDYSVSINNRMRSSSIQVKEYFTKALDNLTCIEGENVHFECEVLDDNQQGLWFKDGIEVSTSDKYKVDRRGKLHILDVIDTRLEDKGEYSVKIRNCIRLSALNVQEFFTKALENKTCIAGENVHFECEVLEDNQMALWFKDGIEVSTSEKYKVERHGKWHRLYVINTRLIDKGEYSVKIKNCFRRAELIVGEIPKAIQLLCEEDRELYMEIIKYGIEMRYYIRIVIIGENGAGKTCLLRRLLRQSMTDVQSTDGIDIHRCKINLANGQWIFDEVSDRKKDLLLRLKQAKTADTEDNNTSMENYPQSRQYVPGLQDDKVTQSTIRMPTGTSHNISERKQLTCNRVEGQSVKSKCDEQMLTATQVMSDNLEMVVESTSQLHHNLITELSNEKVSQVLDDFLNGIEELDIPSDVLVECGLLDFAGEKEYYSTHPIFLNPNAVHLLVANIMKDVKPIKTENGFDKIGGLKLF